MFSWVRDDTAHQWIFGVWVASSQRWPMVGKFVSSTKYFIYVLGFRWSYIDTQRFNLLRSTLDFLPRTDLWLRVHQRVINWIVFFASLERPLLRTTLELSIFLTIGHICLSTHHHGMVWQVLFQHWTKTVLTWWLRCCSMILREG